MSAPSPPRPARTEPMPEGLDDDVRAALPFDSLYRAPGRGVGGRAARRALHRHDRDGERQDARLQPSRRRRARARAEARAFYLYPTKALAQDQARALSALGVKRCGRRSTTATRRPSGAGRSGSGRT